MRRLARPGRQRTDRLRLEEQPILHQRPPRPCDPVALAAQSRGVGEVFLEDDDALAAAVLGRVAGRVRGIHDLRDAPEVRIQDHDADAHAEAERLLAPHELEARDRLEHGVRDLQGIGRSAVLQQQRELVAAEAGHDVRRAHLGAQQLAELPQQLVAGHVAASVVDDLEAIEVHEAHRVGHAGRVAHFEGVLQARLEIAPVLEPGERVVARVVRELLGQRVRGGDVGERALAEQHPAVRVAHGTGVLQHHEPRAVPAAEHQLGVANLAVLGHRLDPVIAVIGIGVDVARHVHGEQLVLGVVAQHAHEGRVRSHELPVHGGLEHAGRDVLEQLAVALLGSLERLERVRALRGVAQHLVHDLRRDLAFHQVVERAALDRLLAEILVLRRHQYHDGDARRPWLQAQEGRHPRAVGQVQVEQQGFHAAERTAASASASVATVSSRCGCPRTASTAARTCASCAGSAQTTRRTLVWFISARV